MTGFSLDPFFSCRRIWTDEGHRCWKQSSYGCKTARATRRWLKNQRGNKAVVEESKMQQGGGKESETKKMVWFHVRMWCSSTSTTNISTKRTTIYHVGKWFQFHDAEMFARAASHLSPWKMILNCGSVTPKRPQVPHTDTPRAPHNGSLWGRVAHPWADLALQSCHLRNGQTSKLKGTLPIIEENGFSSTMLTCLHVLTLTCHRGKCKSWSSTADLIATHTQTHHLRLTTALCGDVLRTLELSLNCRAVTWEMAKHRN